MYMSGESLLIILVAGIIAGWLSGQIVQGTGFGIVGDLLIGIVGTFIGSCATFGAQAAGYQRLPQLARHLLRERHFGCPVGIVALAKNRRFSRGFSSAANVLRY
jgi:uncharacterized membrane protein YeaQ/YmgE (transglycosylase-associated protein family)